MHVRVYVFAIHNQEVGFRESALQFPALDPAWSVALALCSAGDLQGCAAPR